jgi:hypothetical protein
MRITISGLTQDNLDEVVCTLDEANIETEIQFPYAGSVGFIDTDFDDVRPMALFWMIDELTKQGLTATFAKGA